MKNFIVALLILAGSVHSFSQLPNYSAVKLASKADFNTQTNKLALQAASYLLNTPWQKENRARLDATQYLLKWMNGTPEYNFNIDLSMTTLTNKNDDLLVLMMAAMARYVLQNPAQGKNVKAIKLNAFTSFAQYVKKPGNNIAGTEEIKRLVDAYDRGQLKKYLNME